MPMNALPLHSEPESADSRVAASLRALIAGRDVDHDALADYLGISRSSLFNKLAGRTQWKLQEALDAATYFGASVDDLLGGLGGLVTPTSPDVAVRVRKSPAGRKADGASESLSQRVRLEGLEPPTF